MRRILCLLLLFTAAGCTLLDGGTPIPNPESFGDPPAVLLRPDVAPDEPTGIIALDSLSIEADTLRLHVTFGGCDYADFDLIAWNYFLESYPVQAYATLRYEETDCDAIFNQHVRFDLSPLRDAYRDAYQTTDGVIDLSIRAGGDLRAGIRYSF